MINVIIFGSGGHAKVIFSEIIKLKKIKFIGFVDDKKRKGKLIAKYNNKKFYNIGKISEILKKKRNIKGIIGIGSNFVREKISKEINRINKKFKFVKIISKDAVINTNVDIGDGSFVVTGSIINTGTKIGKHCIINTSNCIDHDNIFENFSSTGPKVVTGGSVKLGQFSHIGIGSVVKNNISIAEKTIIGGKSFVNKNCKKNSVYFGSPIKRIRNIKKNYQ